MSQTDLERYTEACNYPGRLDEAAVELHLSAYLRALGIERKIVRIREGWELSEHPSLDRSINAILDDFSKRNPSAARAALAALAALDVRAARAARAARTARDALDARAALDARDALDALDARDARRTALSSVKRFVAWCIQAGGWWYRGWELSFIATIYFGAKELKYAKVKAWSKPLMEAFIAGAWALYWTDDTLFWIAKPTVHRDPTPNTRRLHNDKYAAIESDVENLYFWHGVLVPAFVVVRPDWITVKHIDEEENAEVRRVMIERFKHGEDIHGAAAYMRDAGGKTLDHDERFGTLWRREVADDEPIVILEVINSTREPDGHFKHYWLRVPPNMKTAHEASAWTFDIPVKDYAPLIET